MAVTQPLWPFKDPRKRRDSDMAVSVLEANFDLGLCSNSHGLNCEVPQFRLSSAVIKLRPAFWLNFKTLVHFCG
jgi:hypothetical protein